MQPTLSDAESAKLCEWTRCAFAEAVSAGYVTPPWRPNAQMYGRMLAQYLAGLTPADGAQAAFSTYH